MFFKYYCLYLKSKLPHVTSFRLTSVKFRFKLHLDYPVCGWFHIESKFWFDMKPTKQDNLTKILVRYGTNQMQDNLNEVKIRFKTGTYLIPEPDVITYKKRFFLQASPMTVPCQQINSNRRYGHTH